jgi:TonB family protein
MKKLISIILIAMSVFAYGCASSNQNTSKEKAIKIEYYAIPNLKQYQRKDLIPIDSVIKLFSAENVVLPEIITKKSPDYPDIAKRAQLEATVWLQAFVDSTGSVSKIYIVSSDVEFINQGAVEASSNWTFRPLIVDAKARNFVAIYPILYRINNGRPRVLLPE